jgi:N-formylglutamate deformylase
VGVVTGDALNVETVAGDAGSSWILHVPHASTRIPADVRTKIVLGDDELQAELRAMTDAHTDVLAARISERVESGRPWSFVNGVSRLVVDPERFPDEREVMNRVGMGAVYTRTSTGEPLRAEDDAHRAALISTYFEPYSRALADLVDDRLAATGRAVIFDLHSFPSHALPYELYPYDERPVICLGTDERHTSARLLDAARAAFAPVGSVAVDQPFRGTYVPLRHYGRDDRVESIMLEVRRDAYLRDDGTPDGAAIDRIAAAAARVVDGFVRDAAPDATP